MIKIPTPEFIVLYNGQKEFADYNEIKLSDSFELKNDTCFLELVAKVYNINKGKNAEIASRSPALEGYETFVAEIKENQKTMKLSEAIKLAVKSCINKNILLSFLQANGSEVNNMIFTEWNMEDALAVKLEEGIAIGQENKEKEKKEAIEETLLQTAKKLKDMGFSIAQIVEVTGLSIEQIKSL